MAEPGDRAPLAHVLCVHGLSDHLGRQLPLLRWLAGLGYRAVGFELGGHGGLASAWDRSAWVYEAYLDSDDPAETLARLEQQGRAAAGTIRSVLLDQYEALRRTHVEDHLAQIDRVIALTRALDPALPIVLLGHSMGALLCIEAAWRWRHRSDAPRGAVLLSPALRPKGRPGNAVEGLAIDALWQLRRAPFSLSRSAARAALGLNLPLDTAWGRPWISDQQDEVALFSRDPLVPGRIPTRYVGSIEGQMVETARRGFRFPIPGLMLLPETDGITNPDAGTAFARSVQASVGPERFQLERFAQLCAHDLLRSSRREAARRLIGAWLDELGTGAGLGTARQARAG